MRGIQPNLRAGSSYVEPERMCGLHRRAGAARRILVLVTSRRFPPPWTVEGISVAFKVCDRGPVLTICTASSITLAPRAMRIVGRDIRVPLVVLARLAGDVQAAVDISHFGT
jgi:hypothetical protein